MALLDDNLNPRLSAGKIGGPPTVRRLDDLAKISPTNSLESQFMGNTRNVLQQGSSDVRKAYEKGGPGLAAGVLTREATAGPLAVLGDLALGTLGAARGFGRSAMPASSQYIADRTQEIKDQAGSGNYARALGTTARAAVQGAGMYGVEALDRTLAPWLEMGSRFIDGVFRSAPQPAKPVQPAATSTPTAEGGSPTVQSAAEKAAVRGPSVPSRPVPGTNGVSRIALAGKSPLFTNLDPEVAVSQMSGNPIGVIPAGASPFGGGSAGGELSAALQAAAARGDWDAVRQHYQRGGGTWQGQTAAQTAAASGANILEWDKLIDADKVQEARGKLLESLTNVQPGRDGLSKNQATLLMQLLGQNQQGGQAQAEMALRAKQQADTLGIQQGNLAVAQQQAGTHSLTSLLQAALAGNQLEDSKELRALRQQFQAAKTPEESAALARKILVMQGKDPRQGHDEMLKARAALFGDALKAGASSGMLNGPDGKALTLDQLLAQGQQFMAGTSAPAPVTPRAVAPGQVVDGYRFKGGDPKKESSWEAVQ